MVALQPDPDAGAGRSLRARATARPRQAARRGRIRDRLVAAPGRARPRRYRPSSRRWLVRESATIARPRLGPRRARRAAQPSGLHERQGDRAPARSRRTACAKQTSRSGRRLDALAGLTRVDVTPADGVYWTLSRHARHEGPRNRAVRPRLPCPGPAPAGAGGQPAAFPPRPPCCWAAHARRSGSSPEPATQRVGWSAHEVLRRTSPRWRGGSCACGRCSSRSAPAARSTAHHSSTRTTAAGSSPCGASRASPSPAAAIRLERAFRTAGDPAGAHRPLRRLRLDGGCARALLLFLHAAVGSGRGSRSSLSGPASRA